MTETIYVMTETKLY